MARLASFKEGNVMTISEKMDCVDIMTLLLKLTEGKLFQANQIASICQLFGHFRSIETS